MSILERKKKSGPNRVSLLNNSIDIYIYRERERISFFFLIFSAFQDGSYILHKMNLKKKKKNPPNELARY